jgi:hypothetical protein
MSIIKPLQTIQQVYHRVSNKPIKYISSILLLIGLLFGFLGTINSNVNLHAAPITSGYGCYQYGISTVYGGNCKKLFTQADLSNGVNPFTSIVCNTNNSANVGITTTCIAVINPDYTIPADFRLGVGTNPTGSCNASADTLTCIEVLVTNNTGSQAVRAQIGSGEVKNLNTNVTVNGVTTSIAETITGGVTNLIRTGGTNIFPIVIFIVAVIITLLVIFKRFNH